MDISDSITTNVLWSGVILLIGGASVAFGGIHLINRHNEKQRDAKRKEFVSTIYAAPNHTDTVTVQNFYYNTGKTLRLIDKDGRVFTHDVNNNTDNAFAVRQTEPDDKLLVQATSPHNLRVVQNITKNQAMKQFSKQH